MPRKTLGQEIDESLLAERMRREKRKQQLRGEFRQRMAIIIALIIFTVIYAVWLEQPFRNWLGG